MIPGFFGIESSYIEAPAANAGAANGYLTIVNLHYEPLRLLSASSELFENAGFFDANNQPLEYIEILPGERVAMRPGGMHMQFNNPDAELSAGEPLELTLLIRRGREAMEAVEGFDASEAGAFSGKKSIEAGIPNEEEYVIKVDVRN